MEVSENTSDVMSEGLADTVSQPPRPEITDETALNGDVLASLGISQPLDNLISLSFGALQGTIHQILLHLHRHNEQFQKVEETVGSLKKEVEDTLPKVVKELDARTKTIEETVKDATEKLQERVEEVSEQHEKDKLEMEESIAKVDKECQELATTVQKHQSVLDQHRQSLASLQSGAKKDLANMRSDLNNKIAANTARISTLSEELALKANQSDLEFETNKFEKRMEHQEKRFEKMRDTLVQRMEGLESSTSERFGMVNKAVSDRVTYKDMEALKQQLDASTDALHLKVKSGIAQCVEAVQDEVKKHTEPMKIKITDFSRALDLKAGKKEWEEDHETIQQILNDLNGGVNKAEIDRLEKLLRDSMKDIEELKVEAERNNQEHAEVMKKIMMLQERATQTDDATKEIDAEIMKIREELNTKASKEEVDALQDPLDQIFTDMANLWERKVDMEDLDTKADHSFMVQKFDQINDDLLEYLSGSREEMELFRGDLQRCIDAIFSAEEKALLGTRSLKCMSCDRFMVKLPLLPRHVRDPKSTPGKAEVPEPSPVIQARIDQMRQEEVQPMDEDGIYEDTSELPPADEWDTYITSEERSRKRITNLMPKRQSGEPEEGPEEGEEMHEDYAHDDLATRKDLLEGAVNALLSDDNEPSPAQRSSSVPPPVDARGAGWTYAREVMKRGDQSKKPKKLVQGSDGRLYQGVGAPTAQPQSPSPRQGSQGAQIPRPPSTPLTKSSSVRVPRRAASRAQ